MILQTKNGCVSAFGSLLLSFLFLVFCLLFGSFWLAVWLLLCLVGLDWLHPLPEREVGISLCSTMRDGCIGLGRQKKCLCVCVWLVVVFGLFVCRCLGSCSLISGTVQHWDT